MSKLMLANLNDVVFLGAVMQPTNYDGKPGVKYELDLRSRDGLISVLCTEDAYKQALDIPDYSKVNVAGDFSRQFKSFKVSHITIVK